MELKKVTVPMGRVMSDEARKRLEEEHSGIFLRAVLHPDEGTAEVELLPVLTTNFHIDAWDLTGRLVVREEDEEIWLYRDDFRDPNLFDRLVDGVVYNDNGGAINISGKYFPQSQESVRLFKKLMKTRKDA